MGSAADQFSVNFFFFLKKKINLKHLKLPKNHFKTNLFFSIFGGVDPHPVRSWSDGRLELQTSLEKPSNTSQMTRIIQKSFHGMYLHDIKLYKPIIA